MYDEPVSRIRPWHFAVPLRHRGKKVVELLSGVSARGAREVGRPYEVT
jgi:hypothetical protein